MADYYSLLSRAVANLPKSSPASARKAIYERARKALSNQLRSLKPPLPESDIAREETALRGRDRAPRSRVRSHGGAPVVETSPPPAPPSARRVAPRRRPAAAAAVRAPPARRRAPGRRRLPPRRRSPPPPARRQAPRRRRAARAPVASPAAPPSTPSAPAAAPERVRRPRPSGISGRGRAPAVLAGVGTDRRLIRAAAPSSPPATERGRRRRTCAAH